MIWHTSTYHLRTLSVLRTLLRESWRRSLLACGLCAALLLGSLAVAQTPSANSVWLIPIDTEITPATAQFVRSRVELANRENPLALVFLINTPGGRVDAMQNIVDSILQRAQVPTIAVVEDALSAGALIAMSAERLVMLPGSSIGAALTVMLDPFASGGISAADEKINSATRSQFRSVAEARGRDTRVAEGMVDQRVEIPGLSTSEELITLTSAQAVEHGIADLQASSVRDALEQLGYASVAIERLEPRPVERVANFITSPLVAAALLALGVVGIVIEIFTPGLGIPGGLGLLALSLFFGGTLIASPSGALDIVLMVGGLILLTLELVVIPGFGIAGLLGIAALGFSMFRIFEGNMVAVVGYMSLFATAFIVFALWWLSSEKSAFQRIFALTERIEGGVKTSVAGEASTADTETVRRNPFEALHKQRGLALTDLRPSGTVRFGDDNVDVVSEGAFIPRGSEVEVIRVAGNRVTVRWLEPPSA